ncbi:acetyltransferase [Kineosporia sp. NBRC 101677]|nr:acetyltransferase [Kineosporia sp. NBRC 101677]
MGHMPALVRDVIPAGSWSSVPQPGFRGEGLLLRPWRHGDEPFLLEAYSDPDIQRWHALALADEAEATAWIERKSAAWAGETAADWLVEGEGKALGRIGFRVADLSLGEAEVAYWVAPAARNQQVATRATRALTTWSRAHGLHRLTLLHSTRNEPSCRVAQRCGFALEGTAVQSLLHSDGWHDMHHHALLLDSTHRSE